MGIVERSTDWIEFDAETDEVPFLHMHDLIEVKYKNGYQSPPVPAWSVDFDGLRYPVTAYRVVKKADASEIAQLREALAEIAYLSERFSDSFLVKRLNEIARDALKEKE